MTSTRVFCLGFHKTGTTSVGLALKSLGYKVTGPNWTNESDPEKILELAIKSASTNNAFQDDPWPLLYREMDEHFPGSKFILTIRNEQKWIESVVKHFRADSTRMREWIYGPGRGYPLGNEEIYVDRYRQHISSVIKYFERRPEDLLILNVDEGLDWPPLCAHLGLAIPANEFPIANASYNRNSLGAKTKRYIYWTLRRRGIISWGESPRDIFRR